MLVFLGFLGAVSGSANRCNVVQALQNSCSRDPTCKLDSTDWTGLVAWGKNHSRTIPGECLSDLKRHFPALYVCADDIHTACPSFGRTIPNAPHPTRGHNDNDDDDDDDGGHGSNNKPKAQPPVKGAPPAKGDTPAPVKGGTPVKGDTSVKGAPIKDVPAAVRDVKTLNITTVPISRPNRTGHGPALPPKRNNQGEPIGPSTDAQCLQSHVLLFSDVCRGAIDMQWKRQQQAKGVWTQPPAWTADQLAQMLGHEDTTRDAPNEAMPMPAIGHARSFNPASIPAAGLAALLLLACICCCCCRRCCKKRNQVARVAPGEVPLAPLPDAAVVPVATPVSVPSSSSVPMATAISVPRASAVPSAMPYNGQGLGTYIPMAQPVASHV